MEEHQSRFFASLQEPDEGAQGEDQGLRCEHLGQGGSLTREDFLLSKVSNPAASKRSIVEESHIAETSDEIQLREAHDSAPTARLRAYLKSKTIKEVLNIKLRRRFRALFDELDEMAKLNKLKISQLECDRRLLEEETIAVLRETKTTVISLAMEVKQNLEKQQEAQRTHNTTVEAKLDGLSQAPQLQAERSTYAAKVKAPKSTLILKPLESDVGSKNIIRSLEELDCPTNINIVKVRPTPQGVEVRCGTGEEAERLGPYLGEKLQQAIQVVNKQPRVKKIIIFDVPESTCKDALEDLIKKQYQAETVTVLSTQQAKRAMHEHWVVQVNIRPARELLNRGSLQLGFRKLNVRSFVATRRCYNCQALGDHLAHQCKHHTYCSQCGGNHDMKDCPRKILKCINCSLYNQQHAEEGRIKRSTKRPTDHAASDSYCPTYRALLTERCQ